MSLTRRQAGIASTLAMMVAMLAPGSALAADYTVNDSDSCTGFLTAIGAVGEVLGEQCYVSDGTLPAGDTLTMGGAWDIRPEGSDPANFVNNGTVLIASGSTFYAAGGVINNGTITLQAGAAFLAHRTMTNTGLISVPAGATMVFEDDARMTNALRDDGTCGEISGTGDFIEMGSPVSVSECFDAELRRPGGKLTGRALLNNDGTNQSILWPNKKFKVGTVRWLYLYARNTSGVPDTLTMRASGAVADGFVVQYFRASGAEITDEVAGEAGPFTTPLLQPGKRYGIRVRIEVTSFAPKGSSVLRNLTVGSTTDAHATDVVTFGLTRR